MNELEGLCPAAWWLIRSTRYTHGDGSAAYLAFMVERMLELHRILKATGSIYLHCDHDANAYLRQMMDAIFGSTGFRNEIIWERTRGRTGGKHWGNVTDTILFYSKSQHYVWHNTYLERKSAGKDTKGDLTAAGIRKGVSGQSWNGFNPTDYGRHWAVPKDKGLADWIEQNLIEDYAAIRDPMARLQALDDAGMLSWSDIGRPSIKRPAAASAGAKVNNLWNDVRRVGQRESSGYPTQKPQALAKRIIEASSNPGDMVLDCFAGCAYVPVEAELTGRRWIACDMSPRAWTVVRRQFHKQSNLRMVTEGEYTESYAGVQPDLGPECIIRVRGPNELPLRTTIDPPRPMRLGTLPEPTYRQRPIEDSQTIWDAFVATWGTRCWYCGLEKRHSRRELQLDHIEPNKRDGSNDDCWNRALACIDCNGEKAHRLTVEETMDKALGSGRIETPGLREEQAEIFERRRQWAVNRWEQLSKPLRLPI